MLVNISVHSGHEDFRDRTPLASALAERWYMAPGVKRIDINKQGVQGTLFIPPGTPEIKHFLFLNNLDFVRWMDDTSDPEITT